MKTCRLCDEEKPLLDFPRRKSSADGHHFWCFECKRAKDVEYGAVYRARHPEEKRRAARKYGRKLDRTALLDQRRMVRYKLSPERVAEILAHQDGRCALCREVLTDDFHIDHDHGCCPNRETCGKCTRGFLCRKCNYGIGVFGDDPDRLMAAAAYVLTTRNVLEDAMNLRWVDQTA